MPASEKNVVANKKKLTILVIGASGMLGHMLVRVLSPHHQVIGTTSSKYDSKSPLAHILSEKNWIGHVDVRNLPTVEQAINAKKPDVIINCVGLIKQKMNSEENVSAISINSLFPHQLAEICRISHIRLFHFSTDCVFQGTPGLKHVTDSPNATDLYGLSKLLGEVTNWPCITLRTSIVGRQLTGIESLIEWAISQRDKTVNGYKNAIYSGITTKQLSQTVKNLIENFPDLSGIYQVASSPISKFDLLSKLNTLLELNLNVKPETEFHCDRTLDGTLFSELTNIHIPSWDEMLAELADDEPFYNNF